MSITRARSHPDGQRRSANLVRATWLGGMALVAAFAAALYACSPAAIARPKAVAPATAVPAATVNRIPSATPTVTPSALPTATATMSPTPTATPTNSPTGHSDIAPVPILMYHRIVDLPEDADASRRDYAVSPARFEEQLRYLKEHGYESVSLYTIVNYFRGAGSLPARAVAITFDDGYRDSALVAFPLLVRYGFTATFFINPQPIDDEYPAYMTWAQVEQISRAGMDVESHSYSHPMLTHLSVDDLLQEIRKAGDAIVAHTGKRPRLFSYPFGHYNPQVVDILRGEGYVGAVTLRSGTAQASSTVFDLARVWVRYDDTLETFVAKLERGR